nr:reverse transcriptase domain-containing protein [Tanacetum cinerariifolium]
MLPVTQIDTFDNGLTLRHRDTINAAAGGTFMKRRRKECYDLIENMTAHHNDWILQPNGVNHQVQAVTPNYETCGGPHSFNDSPATVGNIQNEYAARAYHDNSYQPQSNRSLLSYRLDNYLGPPGRNQFFQRANQGQNPPLAYRALGYQALIHQPQIPQPQVITTNEFTNFIKANDAILRNMKTNTTSLTNSNLKLKNMFGQFMKMNTASSSGSGTLPGNTITNQKEELKGITTRSGTAYQGPTIPTTSSSLPSVVERETEATKDTVHPTNNESTKDLARTPLNEHCSTVLLKKLPKKLRDPGKFLIPCDFPGMAECLALADLGASINRMPLSVWNQLPLPELTPTLMTLELADRSISRPIGVTEDVYAKSGSFICRPTLLSLILMLTLEKSDFLLEEFDAFLALEDDPTSPEVDQSYVNTEWDILLLKAFLNDDPSLPPPNQGNYLPQVQKELKICEAKTDKSSIDEPPEVGIKDLPPHLEYAFLEGDDKLPVIVAKDLSVEEKAALITILKSHKQPIAWKLSDIKERMLKRCEDTNLCLNKEKSHFMVKEGIVLDHKISKNGIEVDKAKVDVIAKLPHLTTLKGICNFLGHAGFYQRFIQDFSKIARLMTRLLEKDTPLFFSKECVEAFPTLKRKITEAPILIAPDWDFPFEFMCDASDFAIGVVLGQHQEKHFRPIHYASKTMTEAESNYTTTEKEMLAVVLLLQEFTFKVIDTKGAENLAADHLSRLENPHQNMLDPKEINELFPLETLNLVSSRGNSSTPWFADFANYYVGNFVVKGMSSQQKSKFFKDVKHYF